MINKYQYHTCSGCRAVFRIELFLLKRILLNLKHAKCFKCSNYCHDLGMCSELGQCPFCRCHSYIDGNSVCKKYHKSKW